VRYLASIIVLALAASPAASAPKKKRAPAPQPSISLATLKGITETLSSDAFEGRAPGTPGEEKSIKLIAERMAAAGLKPGNQGSWFQDVPIVEITAGDMKLDVAGGSKPLSFAYKTDFVGGTYRQSGKIDVKDSSVVFVGYGINAPERGWNDYAGVDVKGKTVVILINDPDYEVSTLTGAFGGRAMTYYGRWTYKFEEAARQGAAAALIVHDTFPAAYPWGVVVSSWTGPQVHIDLANKGMDQTQVNGWISNEAATQLLAADGKNLIALTAAAKQKGFRAVPLSLKASVSFSNTLRNTKSKNVVGILPGKTRPKETVLYSAGSSGRLRTDQWRQYLQRRAG
jgi:hypothetical protein